MSRIFTNSLAAVAAVVLAATSIGSIVTVPPANAQAAPSVITTAELA